MIKIYSDGVFVDKDKNIITKNNPSYNNFDENNSKKNTLTYNILKNHNKNSSMENLNIKFDALASHDITYVGIIQTAKASGLEKFPMPYVLTNCHNSLCSVGGTINQDDHVFGLSAAKKFGGIYVPANFAVIHSYMREIMAAPGKMILGSDSHTRYGALGTLGIGEGGGELAKQLLDQTYDIRYPDVVGVYLKGKLNNGVGSHDVALSLIKSTFENGIAKNKVLEFFGEGIKYLNQGTRNGIDVMTTETTCLSSIWETDQVTEEYLSIHNREDDYKELKISDTVFYDGLIEIDLSKIKPMIGMPFHPSNVYEIDFLNKNLEDILSTIEKDSLNLVSNSNLKLNLRQKIKNGKFQVDQGIICGCSGGIYENISNAVNILDGNNIGNGEFNLSIYPDSQPNNLHLNKIGFVEKILEAGGVFKTAFCGPCFGAGEVPKHEGFSIRHTTRNFSNRDGSRPGDNQITSVALMDAKSIAATGINKGILTPATDIDTNYNTPKYFFNSNIYKNRCYNGYNNPKKDEELIFGPNITDWPKMISLTENVLLKVATFITDPITTTDEIIPSGETSSYRSNPLRLSEFTFSRRDPEYVNRAKEIYKLELERQGNINIFEKDYLKEIINLIKDNLNLNINSKNTSFGSTIFAIKPGDGSAREQAASCQKVLGGLGNIVNSYATKRYRSNLINWGILPLVLKDTINFELNDYIFIPNIKNSILNKDEIIKAYVIKNNTLENLNLTLENLTDKEREILISGSLINFNKNNLISK